MTSRTGEKWRPSVGLIIFTSLAAVAALQVRNRLVAAYQEVMSLQA